MSVFRSGICAICGDENHIVKSIPSIGRLCYSCNKKRLNSDRTKKVYVYEKKPTGELKLFKEIFEERPKICTHCQKELPYFNVSHFSHIKSKGMYPELRLDKDNIRILCFDCHFAKDHQTKAQFEKRKRGPS